MERRSRATEETQKNFVQQNILFPALTLKTGTSGWDFFPAPLHFLGCQAVNTTCVMYMCAQAILVCPLSEWVILLYAL
jgi:hypothetical protein